MPARAGGVERSFRMTLGMPVGGGILSEGLEVCSDSLARCTAVLFRLRVTRFGFRCGARLLSACIGEFEERMC